MLKHIVRGALLNPRPDGTVAFHPDGVLAADERGHLTFVGDWQAWTAQKPGDMPPETRIAGVLTPPFLDIHTHIPQHPIRGRFTEGLDDDPPEGRLLAGLRRNVFPAEARASNPDYAAAVVQAFTEDTLAQGVVGGAAYMTVHASAAQAALRGPMSTFWSVGLVLMDQHCPENLRTDTPNLERDLRALAGEFGPRLIVTDRFAVACGSALRRQASRLAGELGLRTQTHLNEQRAEKALVDQVLYPDYASYTDVYRQDGLLDHQCLLAHCLQMTPAEWNILAETGSAIAHCPTSNTLLGSGVLSLDSVQSRRLPYALGTDVGASPTTSMLAEMAQFARVHAGRFAGATPSEALWRSTLAPAQILNLDGELGSFDVGKPLSFIEIACDAALSGQTADGLIAQILELTRSPSEEMQSAWDRLATSGLDHGPALTLLTEAAWASARRLEAKVRRVVLRGSEIFFQA